VGVSIVVALWAGGGVGDHNCCKDGWLVVGVMEVEVVEGTGRNR
jgi:hypothetical protein